MPQSENSPRAKKIVEDTVMLTKKVVGNITLVDFDVGEEEGVYVMNSEEKGIIRKVELDVAEEIVG
jgi:hypothetical protein